MRKGDMTIEAEVVGFEGGEKGHDQAPRLCLEAGKATYRFSPRGFRTK